MIEVDEIKRLEEVKTYLSLNIDLIPELRRITLLASEICDKPISMVTLLDNKHNWINAAIGVDHKVELRETSFCQHTIRNNTTLIIRDTKHDSRFTDNPLVNSEPGVKFYAGSPLISCSGHKIGALCLIDIKAGDLNDLQQRTLELLSRQVMFILESELNKRNMRDYIEIIEKKNNSLRAIAQLQSHEIRHPLATIMGLVNLMEEEFFEVSREWLSMVGETAKILDLKIHSIVDEAMGNSDIKLLKFNKMVEEIEDYAILLLDANGIIENWNKGANIIKGYESQEIVGRNFEIFYTAEQQMSLHPNKLLETARTEGIARDEGYRVRRNGSHFYARVVVTAIHNDAGEVIGFTKVTRDISQDKVAVENQNPLQVAVSA